MKQEKFRCICGKEFDFLSELTRHFNKAVEHESKKPKTKRRVGSS